MKTPTSSQKVSLVPFRTSPPPFFLHFSTGTSRPHSGNGPRYSASSRSVTVLSQLVLCASTSAGISSLGLIMLPGRSGIIGYDR
ncbi:hypothetical protein K469DRAFT_776582 [Zopfia rhizophila CBS 207.26]|uniref:Uncharacterized protein n=1 Tax=Zopfia rhizophila CBS 207.26 TaxID=1314779 RepID=A0A6A6E5C6_9PEZI|nr:hypothetical protein K469DRAFT_776582 [Zopfia rhizophila CBS 207.26]